MAARWEGRLVDEDAVSSNDSPTLYGQEVVRLICLTREDQTVMSEKLPVLARYTEGEVLRGATRILYLLEHNLGPCGLDLITGFGYDTDSYRCKQYLSQLYTVEQRWRNNIMEAALSEVEKTIAAWQEDNVEDLFGDLTLEQIGKLWFKRFDADPIGCANTLFQPLIQVLDINRIFHTDRATSFNDTEAKFRAVGEMMRVQYVFACKLTYHFRVLKNDKASTYTSTRS